MDKIYWNAIICIMFNKLLSNAITFAQNNKTQLRVVLKESKTQRPQQRQVVMVPSVFEISV